MRILVPSLFLSLAASTAAAEVTVSLPLALGAMGSVTSHIYSCDDGEEFAVRYVNAGANALAILPVDGEDRIFVNVVSASGAKYVSGAHVWWTKGDTATFLNELADSAPVECRAAEAPGSE